MEMFVFPYTDIIIIPVS